MIIKSVPKTIISNEDSPFCYFAWPSVARLRDGTLAAVCSGFRMRHICPFGKAVISYSRDEGRSWTRPAPVIDTPLDDRDAGLLVTDDRVILTSFNNTAAFQKKVIGTQEGRSAELIRAYIGHIPDDAEEKYLGSTYVISRDGGYTFGEVKRSPVTSPHGPCIMPDGRIIWVGRRFSGGDDREIVCCELDENENFVPISKIVLTDAESVGAIACEPFAVVLPDGGLLAAMRVERGGEKPLFTVYTCVSDDGGRTFSVPERAIGDEEGAPPHMIVHSSGRVILTYACRKGDRGIRARISCDGGRTFGDEIRLTGNVATGDLGYPASVELSDGSVLTVYYERGDDHAVIKQIIWNL